MKANRPRGRSALDRLLLLAALAGLAGAIIVATPVCRGGSPDAYDCVKDVLALVNHPQEHLTRLEHLSLDDKIRLLDGLVLKNRAGQSAADFHVLMTRDARVLSDDAKTISGVRVKKALEPSLDADVSGIMNQGVYFYDGPRGDSRVLKIFSEEVAADAKATEAGGLPGHEAYVQHEFLLELRNAYIAEKVGGPKVLGYGSILKNGETSFYLEMEELFAHQHAPTLKSLEKVTGAAANVLGPHSAEDAADLLMKCLRENIVPRDTDMMIGHGGKLRWLDSGMWCLARECPPFADKFAGAVTALSRQLDMTAINAARPAAVAGRLPGAEMIDTFLARLQSESGIAPAEKDALVQALEKLRAPAH